jgi:hypothetical protein
MKVQSLASVLALAAFTGACEKQSYSETRAFSHHGSHGAEHGTTHGSDKSHAPAPAPAAKPEPAAPAVPAGQ